MTGNGLCLETPRLRLRGWRHSDRDTFAALNDDPEVMKDLGGTLDRRESDQKFDDFAAKLDQYGYGRLVIETRAGQFAGYAGVLPCRDGHPMAPHNEIGWRLVRSAWGQGYATEAARAALDDVFTRVGLSEVLAYTAPDNLRSQAVMERLKLRRDPKRDFTSKGPKSGDWHGLVWVARRDRWNQ